MLRWPEPQRDPNPSGVRDACAQRVLLDFEEQCAIRRSPPFIKALTGPPSIVAKSLDADTFLSRGADLQKIRLASEKWPA